MIQASLLVIDDDNSVREALVTALEDVGYRVYEADGVVSSQRALEQTTPDAILLDIRLRDGDGLELLKSLRSSHPHVPVIMATAYGDSERTISAMRAGAFEYVTKPFDFDKLLSTVARAVRVPIAARMSYEPQQAGQLLGTSPVMLDVWKAIGRASASLAPVLVTGESGVGKELVARAIHEHSERNRGPFVAVNLAALPVSLIESELFGHEKGAFTGALARREGRFEIAQNGTLFLDEIGDLDLSLQTKLLRVLETKEFERVGAAQPIPTSARIIAATSKPVAPGVQGSSLREDLYYRLGVVRIHVPALRERKQDIPLFVDAFLRSEGRGRRAISENALRRLVGHDWRGNVRELRHTLEQACIMSSADVLDVTDLRLPELGEQNDEVSNDDDLNLATQVAALEKKLISRALVLAKGNRAQAARLLGIRRALLYSRLSAMGVGQGASADDSDE